MGNEAGMAGQLPIFIFLRLDYVKLSRIERANATAGTRWDCDIPVKMKKSFGLLRRFGRKSITREMGAEAIANINHVHKWKIYMLFILL